MGGPADGKDGARKGRRSERGRGAPARRYAHDQAAGAGGGGAAGGGRDPRVHVQDAVGQGPVRRDPLPRHRANGPARAAAHDAREHAVAHPVVGAARLSACLLQVGDGAGGRGRAQARGRLAQLRRRPHVGPARAALRRARAAARPQAARAYFGQDGRAGAAETDRGADAGGEVVVPLRLPRLHLQLCAHGDVVRAARGQLRHAVEPVAAAVRGGGEGRRRGAKARGRPSRPASVSSPAPAVVTAGSGARLH
mmetsp:Transcript_49345/g.158533  ORF Transcript_49345/g.158533 Transcript_49345/m.158533 type:complete len:252 (-) Transcript_49345:93-848(-)